MVTTNLRSRVYWKLQSDRNDDNKHLQKWVCVPSMVILCTEFFSQKHSKSSLWSEAHSIQAPRGLWGVRTYPGRVVELRTPG